MEKESGPFALQGEDQDGGETMTNEIGWDLASLYSRSWSIWVGSSPEQAEHQP